MESVSAYSLDVLAMSRVSRSFRRALSQRAHWNEVGGWAKALRENPYPKGISLSFSFSSGEGCLRLGEALERRPESR
jgi:hypothetical protein